MVLVYLVCEVGYHVGFQDQINNEEHALCPGYLPHGVPVNFTTISPPLTCQGRIKFVFLYYDAMSLYI